MSARLLAPRENPLSRIRAVLPRGGLLPDDAWQMRHRWVVRVLVAHVVAILGLALLWSYPFWHAALESSIVAIAAIVAAVPSLGRRMRSVAATFGLMSSSAILVHLSGGYIEMHFHFFVMIILISLYQDWTPFLLAIGYVVLHHGIFGVIDPGSVYNHPDALANPVKWAVIHGAFILAASFTSLAGWRLSEDQLTSRLSSEKRARQTAEAALRLREEFLSVATHELRTPVTSIKGYTQLALRAARSESADRNVRVHDLLYRLDEQCDRLSRLVTQLLDVSRIESGKTVLDVAPADIDELVQRVVDTARQLTDVHAWQVRIERVPRLAIDGDRIEQVITNLLDNAIRYSPSGGTIAVSVGSDDRHVRISVADEGIGIAPEHVAHIFDRFYQAHRREQRGGMGLGLYISQQIVLAHGGDIAVEVLPRGTRFTVTLPLRLARAEPSAPAGSRTSSIVRGPERATAAPEGGRTILVVEDEGAIRSILSAVLSEAGYRVVLADEGAHALRILDDLQPDLIVLDKLMPELDGTGFAKAYRMTPGRHAPILALCAARDAAEWAGRIGAVGWISKPFDMDDLLNEVRRVLETPLGSIHSIA